MSSTNYFLDNVKSFIRGYETAEEVLSRSNPTKVIKDLNFSYGAIHETPYLGKIEKRSALDMIVQARDELQCEIGEEYPELFI